MQQLVDMVAGIMDTHAGVPYLQEDFVIANTPKPLKGKRGRRVRQQAMRNALYAERSEQRGEVSYVGGLIGWVGKMMGMTSTIKKDDDDKL